MGLETPNAGPIPYDVFIGRGWSEDFAFQGEDLSDVTAVSLGLTRKGRPRVQYDLTMTVGELVLGYVPPEGEEAAGTEPDNAVLVRLPAATTADWVEGVYAFDIALTRADGAIETPLEGLVQIREPA